MRPYFMETDHQFYKVGIFDFPKIGDQPAATDSDLLPLPVWFKAIMNTHVCEIVTHFCRGVRLLQIWEEPDAPVPSP